MIPVSLKIKGLYSYQEEQVIRFDRLIEAQLFGIFGSVGSGKSSILEAIAFALYGDTERLNKSDSRNYNMMNLKSDELLIDFVFENHDDRQYRFVVQGKRNRKHFDEVKTFTRSAYQWQEQQWLPMESASATHILGLSYENFRRTIIIPQGKFQEFLQLSDKARTDMLREIFQLDRFEFFQQTASLERKNNDGIQQLRGRLMSFEDVDDEKLKSRQESLDDMRLALEKLQEHIKAQEAIFKEQEQLKQLFDQLASAQEEYGKLSGESERHEGLERQVADYEYAERNFRLYLLQYDELQEIIAKRKGALEKHAQDAKICDARLMQLQQDFVRAQAEHQKLDGLRQRQADLECALRIKTVEASQQALHERVAKGQAVVSGHKNRQEKLQRDMAALQLAIKELQGQMPDMQQLSALQAWYAQKAFLEDKKQQQEQEYQLMREKAGRSMAAYQEFLQKASLEDTDDVPMRLRALWEESERAAKQIQEHIMHDQLQLRLGDFAASLHDGKACPLCGAMAHPEVLVVANVQEALDRKAAMLQEVRKRQDELMQWEQNSNLLLQERKNLMEQVQLWQERLAQTDTNRQAHAATFSWENYSPDDVGVVEEALKKARSLKQEMATLEQDRSATELEWHRAERDGQKYEQALHRLIAEQGAKEGELSTLKGQLKTLSLEVTNRSDEDLAMELTKIGEHVAQVVKQYEEVQSLLAEQQRLKAALAERIASVEDNLKAESERMAMVREQLQQALSNSYFDRMEAVRAVLQQSIAVQDLRKQLEQYKQQLYSAREKLLHIEQQLAGNSFDAAAFAVLATHLMEQRQAMQEQNDRYVTEKAVYERHTRMLKEKVSLSQQLEQLERRAANLGVLKNLFKGSGFVSYISSVYLQQLCDAANKRFHKLTRQQLQLEVTDRNEFQVRDFLNDGKVRLAKTLSGGQTFQASLSLALALAESVQQQNKAKQNFFFLDEGFGSLDKESLSVAFDTLKSLRKENRIVGIISHVEELQQEMDVYLNVVNDAEKGTKVKGSWEDR